MCKLPGLGMAWHLQGFMKYVNPDHFKSDAIELPEMGEIRGLGAV